MRITLLILLLSLACEGYAQVVGGVPAKGLDMQTGPSGFVTQLPMAPPETIGDVYLDNQWSVTDIKLYNKTKLEGFLTRLNLETNELEIKYNDQVRVLSAAKIHQFTWLNGTTNNFATFINGKEYNLNGAPIEGFFQEIQSGNWSLLSRPNLVLIKNTYVAALDAGERNNKLVKREEFYLQNQTRLFKTNLSKKKFLDQFPSEQQGGIKEFMSSKKIGTKNIGDLMLLTEYLNTLGI